MSDDPIGVEICAAAKNVIAIACGISRGFGTGDNTAALLMTRGLAEMSRLVNAYGGKAITCMGLAGMGDLIATCTSSHSRNAAFGRAFAEGESLEHYCERTHMVVEGALACISIREAAKKLNVDVPIADAVWNLLYGGFSFDDVFESLVQRTPKDEFYGLA